MAAKDERGHPDGGLGAETGFCIGTEGCGSQANLSREQGLEESADRDPGIRRAGARHRGGSDRGQGLRHLRQRRAYGGSRPGGLHPVPGIDRISRHYGARTLRHRRQGGEKCPQQTDEPGLRGRGRGHRGGDVLVRPVQTLRRRIPEPVRTAQ